MAAYPLPIITAISRQPNDITKLSHSFVLTFPRLYHGFFELLFLFGGRGESMTCESYDMCVWGGGDISYHMIGIRVQVKGAMFNVV